ncbi:hypothetical protein [Legionella fallonii]|uniref:Coiled-coil protein n=1 Tax=Legionella fallonii LLAP-10 TaxID=1212491 RepID=A0A098FZL7_9GAMM|nr:hypothetical protein [Legionella fallonii]CEG55678.1 conserved membrane protein of unknown function [Legionella fallonii LLAP-10]
MTPVIRHLQSNFLNLSLFAEQQPQHWSFDKSIKQLGPELYTKLVAMHPVVNMEYSILCSQIQHNLSFPERVKKEHLIEQLTAALMIAELLEQLHHHYLAVPREVARLRRHQAIYRSMLTELAGYSFSTESPNTENVDVGLSLSQLVRENTALANWFRLLLTRSKRLFNLLELVGTGSEAYSRFVAMLDQYTNPFFAYLAWCFFLPRFVTNMFLLLKHTIPGFWMEEKEKSLDWCTRFVAQIQRRWFELGNDVVWITVGLLNCFLFIGPLAPVSIYLTVAAFAFDIANTSFRAYIELNRLFELQEYYTALWGKEENEESRQAIKEYQNYITHRIQFEQLRLWLSVANAVAVFLSMSLALPFLVSSPVIPFIGAAFLIAVWVASYTLTQMLEQHRPNDIVEKPANVSKLGFFAQKEKVPSSMLVDKEPTPELEDTSPSAICSPCC